MPRRRRPRKGQAQTVGAYTHACIRPDCTVQYQSADPEPFYCPPHDQERKLKAEEVDRKIKARGPSKRQQLTDYQKYEQITRGRGYVQVTSEGDFIAPRTS